MVGAGWSWVQACWSWLKLFEQWETWYGYGEDLSEGDKDGQIGFETMRASEEYLRR